MNFRVCSDVLAGASREESILPKAVNIVIRQGR